MLCGRALFYKELLLQHSREPYKHAIPISFALLEYANCHASTETI
jgi:hypothetical protein